MNVVFIGPFGLQPKATMSTRALPLARALVAKGHKVTVLIPPWDDPDRSGQTWLDEGVRVINIALPGGVLTRLPLIFHILLAHSLVVHTLALRPEAVHFFKPKAYAGLAHFILWWLRRLKSLSLRLIVDTDDWEQAWNEVMPYTTGQKRIFVWQERWGLTHADSITVASRALADLIITETGVEGDKIFYVPNGVSPHQNGVHPDSARPPAPNGLAQSEAEPSSGTSPNAAHLFSIDQGPIVLLYSRFVEFRVERIVTLVNLVASHLPEARWMVVGRGLKGEEQTLAAKLAQAGLDRHVRFSGWVPADQLQTYFEAADAAVHLYEDNLINRTKCSVKLIDLLTAGVPVVANAVGQNCEYIQHGQSGFLVPPDDDQTFAKVLVDLLQNPETRQQVGRTARQYLRDNFAWSCLVQTVERAYCWSN